jgi:Hypothetical glycosyl hydrolase family 15
MSSAGIVNRMRSSTRRWARRSVLLVIALLAGCAGNGTAIVGDRASRPAGSAPVRVFSEFLDEAAVRATTTAQWASIARSNAIVVLNSWDYDLIPVLKRANPRVEVWVYKDLSGVRTDDCTTASGECGSCPAGVTDSQFLSSGLGYCWVRRNEPAWLLTSVATAQPLRFRGYPHTWETDYGNAAYQRQWLRNVITDVRRHGWDGVAVDNALTTAGAYGVASRYRTDAAVQNATYGALRVIGPGLRRAGIRSVFNVGYPTMFAGLWQRWLSVVGGLEQEFYLSFGTQPDVTGASWLAYQSEVSSCAAASKSCWFHVGQESAPVSAQTAAYGLASYLLGADGRQAFATGSATSGTGIQDRLGIAVHPMIAAGGAYLRYFTQGVAVVNPWQVSVVVRLGGIYDGAGGRPVTVITLGPASGAVLRAAAAHSAANLAP